MELLELVGSFFEVIKDYLTDYPELLALIGIMILGGRSSDDSNPFRGARLKLSSYPYETLEELFKMHSQYLHPSNHNTLDIENGQDNANSSKIHENMAKIAEDTVNYLNKIKHNISNHNESVMNIIGGSNYHEITEVEESNLQEKLKKIEANREKRVWRIAGAVITSILLVIFIFADFTQATNAIALSDNLGPQMSAIIHSNRWLDYVAPLGVLISSIGTNFTLALIIIDCLGITDFIPWEGETNKEGESTISIKRPVFYLSIAFFIFNIILTFFIATSRITVLDEQPILSDYMVDVLKQLQIISEVMIIIPLLFTTFILFWGVMIIVVIYSLFIRTMLFFLICIIGSINLFIRLITMLKQPSDIILWFILICFAFIFTLFGFVLGLVLYICERTTSVIEGALETLITILNSPVKLINFIYESLASLFQPKKEQDSTPQPTVK